MRPVIGITVDGTASLGEQHFVLRCNYVEAVTSAGGLPIMLPWQGSEAETLLHLCDGLLVSGGDPGVSVKKGRTEFETSLLRAALASGIPILGICNGMQMLGQILGAELVETRPASGTSGVDHMPGQTAANVAHKVQIQPGTRLSALNGSSGCCEVNSLHLQVITDTGDFTVSARSPDGQVEAIEGPGWSLGLQWHPEYQLTGLDQRIFSDFVMAARDFAKNGEN